jgi:hypothetical protein
VKRWLTRYKDQHAEVLSLGPAAGVPNQDFATEDLFPADFYTGLVEEVYAKQLAAAGVPKLALTGTGMLCKRVDTVFPDDKLEWKPHPDARSVRDEFRQVTIGLEFSSAQLRGEKLDVVAFRARQKADAGKPKTRASMVSEMEAAIAISYPLVEKSPTPLLIGWIRDQAEHYGKLVSNYRAVGIVPPIAGSQLSTEDSASFSSTSGIDPSHGSRKPISPAGGGTFCSLQTNSVGGHNEEPRSLQPPVLSSWMVARGHTLSNWQNFAQNPPPLIIVE